MSPNPPLDRAFPADPASTSVLFPFLRFLSCADRDVSGLDRRSNRLKLRALAALGPATMHNKILPLPLPLSLSLSFFLGITQKSRGTGLPRRGRSRNSAGRRCATRTISERDPPLKNSGGYDYVSSAETDRAERL